MTKIRVALFQESIEYRSKKNIYLIFCLFAIPLTFAMILVAYWGVWGSYQVGDDAGAVKMVQWVNEGNPNISTKCYRVLTATISPTHWTPISTSILYPTLKDDSNWRIIIINLIVLSVGAILSGCFALSLGAAFIPSLICSLYIASSQVLVLTLASCWGMINILPSVFTIIQAMILWGRLKDSINKKISSINWCFIFGYLFFFILAMLTKESGIRSVLLIFGVFFVVFFYYRDKQFSKELILLSLMIIIWLVLYFTIRYFFTEANIPILRTIEPVEQDYHLPRLAFVSIVKNAITLIVGNLTTLNSYKTYIYFLEKDYLLVFPRLIPAMIVGAILFGGGVVIALTSSVRRISVLLVAVLIICSFFPEVLLGKVSEMYAMAGLWPLAILLSLVLTIYIRTKKLWLRLAVMLIVGVIILTNIFSARAKVIEIVKSGEIAHGLRMSMLELTEDLPKNSKIAVIFRPSRPKGGFSRFGEKGIQSGCGSFINRPHNWKFFPYNGEIPDKNKFDIILIENEKQTDLQVYYININE